MKILLSAFACAPNVGSEAGAAWRWAMELARHHEVVVITDEFRRLAIEAELAQNPMDNPRFVFFRPRWLRHVPFRSPWSRLLYIGWQYSLLPYAKRLHQQYQFDYVHHLTWGVFRHPSFLGLLGVPFVIGPLGGGDDAPLRLKRSIHGVAKMGELYRTGLNWIARFSPVLWWAMSRAIVIFVRTPDTARMLPYGLGKRAVVAQENGTILRPGIAPKQAKTDSTLRVIFAGRLLALKGIHFGIAAVAHAQARGCDVHITVIGSGPYEHELRRLATKLGVPVEFISQMPQVELFKRYRDSDCLLFPSLRDPSPNVVLEALSFALPVITLDLAGTVLFVNEECGTVVNTHNKSEGDIEVALGEAIVELATRPEVLTQKSEGALRRAEQLLLERQFARVMAVIEAALERKSVSKCSSDIERVR